MSDVELAFVFVVAVAFVTAVARKSLADLARANAVAATRNSARRQVLLPASGSGCDLADVASPQIAISRAQKGGTRLPSMSTGSAPPTRRGPRELAPETMRSRGVRPTRSVGRSGGMPSGFYRLTGKRLFDIAFVVAMLPLVVPLVAVLGLLVRLDGGPAFYLHERVGKHGKSFKCIKLRTMVPDSATRLEAYFAQYPEQRVIWEREYKLSPDPRITPLGKMLRTTSLDEFPQFFNVLLGHMSLVGPRPVTRPELAFYGEEKSALLSERPGLTGPWQVLGRNALGYKERVRLDLDYVRTIGFWGDLKLVWRTVGVALRGTGM